MGAGPENPVGPPAQRGWEPPAGAAWAPPPAPVQRPWTGAPLAGWWSRVGAFLLDGIIVIVPFLAILATGFAVSHGNAARVAVVLVAVVAWLAAELFYAPLLMKREGDHNGQTLGKQAVGIRVVRDNGEPFSLGSAFMREFVVKTLLFRFAGAFLFSIPTLLDWLWPLWDGENRALHDMIVSTHVVRA
jgi:uncharacterized RDD family membrane protein YckC